MEATTRMTALVLGSIFVAVGFFGFVPNPIVSPTGLLATNAAHNIVRIFSSVVLLAGIYTSLGATMALRIVGVICAMVAILGFILSGDVLLCIIHINQADRWLHVVLAIVILGAGFGLPWATIAERASTVR